MLSSHKNILEVGLSIVKLSQLQISALKSVQGKKKLSVSLKKLVNVEKSDINSPATMKQVSVLFRQQLKGDAFFFFYPAEGVEEIIITLLISAVPSIYATERCYFYFAYYWY